MNTKTMAQFNVLKDDSLTIVTGGENWVRVGPSAECIDGKIFGTCRVRWDWVAENAANCFVYGWYAAIGGDRHCGRP